MDFSTNGKQLLLPPVAGAAIMQRYDMYCEDRYNWAVRDDAPLLERTLSGHAPFEWPDDDGRILRVNPASTNEDYRLWSEELQAAYLRQAAQTPHARLVVMHSAPRYWPQDAGVDCAEVRPVSEYGLLVEALKRLGHLAGELGLRIVVENNCTRWDEVPVTEEWDPERHLGHVRQYFSTYPEEWAQLAADIDEPALGLCLDTSHVTNFSQRFPLEMRPAIYQRFIDLAGDRLWHVHWNDNYMTTREGRTDPHLNLGQGTVPREVHQRLWRAPSVKTMLLEHWRGEEALVEELAFIKKIAQDDK